MGGRWGERRVKPGHVFPSLLPHCGAAAGWQFLPGPLCPAPCVSGFQEQLPSVPPHTLKCYILLCGFSISCPHHSLLNLLQIFLNWLCRVFPVGTLRGQFIACTTDWVFRFSLSSPSEPQLGLTLKNAGQHSGWYPSFWREQENRARCYGVVPPGVVITRLSTVWAGRTLYSGLPFGTLPGLDTQSW